VEESKIDHDASKDVEEDVRDVITEWIELPEIIIDSITQNSDGLVSRALSKSEDLKYISPIEAFNLWIGINHRIIPVGKLVSQ
jgi:hypothetical protein